MAVSPDKTQLVLWGLQQLNPDDRFLITYNIPGNTWSDIIFAPSLQTLGFVSVVIDPTSRGMGVMYAPAGCYSGATMLGMCLNNLDKRLMTYESMPKSLMPDRINFFSFVYCTLRKTMLLYGGVGGNNNETNPNLYEYSPSNSIWSLVVPQGNPPGDIQRHCMVETTDGTKMIVFGGMNLGQQVKSRLSIFHVENMTWTEGADAGAANARMGHVCATNGDSFVVWGGLTLQNGKAVMTNNIPLIYNIPKNKWVHTFVVTDPPPPILSNTTSASTFTRPMPSPSDNASLPSPSVTSSSVGAAVGGAVGGIAAVAAIGFFIFKRRRRRGNIARSSSQSKGLNSDHHMRSKAQNGGGNASDDINSYDNNPGSAVLQLPSTSVQRPAHPYSHSPPHFVQQFQSSPLQTEQSFLLHGGNSWELKPDNMRGHDGKQGEPGSPGSWGISSSLHSPPSFQSTISPSMTGSPQGFIRSFPVDQQHYSHFYDGAKADSQGPFRSINHHSTDMPYSGYPQYTPIGLDSQDSRLDLRSPQQPGPGVEMSPAAWMAAMNTRSFFGNPHGAIGHRSHVSGEIGVLGSYFPSPPLGSYFPSAPGQQSPAQPEPDLIQMKLMLMKAQHELELEKIRREQESQRQLVGRQLNERQFASGSE
ncbi:hypothetical protein EMPS_04829 [Entomortierella parvispora]|uniref:Uncharacterized protein n=1 Tax=Entomortierella parvispora TaxID=205924 RepID=A0A9P3H949_9FUNG|nr:hypothetical protein EMPS_04829 [Entomortierella parvispora]